MRSSTTLLYFASEIKALLPFLPEIETDPEALAEYLTFQYTIGERTLFQGRPATAAGPFARRRERDEVEIARYWDVQYEIDFDHKPELFRAPDC